MKISFKGDYALKIILDLALNYGVKVLQLGDISSRQDIPRKYLEQIVTILKNARYVNTTRGPKGGITLAKSPEKIRMGEIIRLMDGHTSPITCVSTTNFTRCSYQNKCVFRPVFGQIKDEINKIVDNITFAELVKRQKELENKNYLDYAI